MLSRNLKNVLVVSVGFLFLFMAAGGLQNLQVSKRWFCNIPQRQTTVALI